MDAAITASRTAVPWRPVIALAGVLFVALTFHEYRRPSHAAVSARAVKAWTPAEADQRLSAAQTYLKDHPEDLGALMEQAVAYYSKGPDSYVDAMNSLEKARALGAVDPTMFFYAGVMYDALGLSEYAINDLRRYLRHDPEDYEAQVRLANLYFRTGNDSEAYAAYQQATKEWPKDATVLFNYGVVSVKKGDFVNAEHAIQDSQKLSGQMPLGGFFELGEIARLKGDDPSAIAQYQQELIGHPDYLPALEALESALKRKGDQKEARSVRAKITALKSAQPHG